MSEQNDYPYAHTAAATLLTGALRETVVRKRISLRQLAKTLGYKQSVVLSHMASGRVPIPIERAPDLARAAGVEEVAFVRAVLEQRYPEIKWDTILGVGAVGSGQAEFVWKVESAAGKPVSELTDDQVGVILEVAASPGAGRRWIATPEVGAIELLRRVRPEISTRGLARIDAEWIDGMPGN